MQHRLLRGGSATSPSLPGPPRTRALLLPPLAALAVASLPPPTPPLAAAHARSRRFLSTTTTTSATPPGRYVYPEARPEEGQGSSQPSPPRFYAPLTPPDLPAGATTVALPAEEARHALRVLRLRPGDPVELCDGAGRVARGEVAAAQPGKGADGWAVTVALVGEVVEEAAEEEDGGRGTPQLVVAAACLNLKGGRDDWLVEKVTEMGAAAVLPLATERSPLRAGAEKDWALGSGGGGGLGDSGGGRPAGGKRRKGQEAPPPSSSSSSSNLSPMLALGSGGRLARVAAAATKQCLRARAPVLLPPATVEALADRLRASGGRDRALVATGGAPPVLEQVQRVINEAAAAQQQPRQLYLIVGPEGDFTRAELDALLDADSLPCGLGANRLRTETAAVALLAAAAAVAEGRRREKEKQGGG